jgi:hypothetical protein
MRVLDDGHIRKEAVLCNTCGKVELTKAQYHFQLAAPDLPWRCPKCAGVAVWAGDDDEEDG